MREELLLELTGLKETQVGSLQLPRCARAQGEPELVFVFHSHTALLLLKCK